MEFQNIAAFILVSETLSFSKAAEQLFITQPAVSKRIRALETELKTPLFDRIGKRVQLTQAGKTLLPGALRIFSELSESKRAIENLKNQVSGKLSIATSHHIGLHRLPPVLRLFIQQYPDVDLDIRFMDSEEACQSVHNGDVELAIATLPEQDAPQLKSEIIWHDPLKIVISSQHPEANSSQIPINKLSQIPAILPSQNTFTRKRLENALSLTQHSLTIAMETNYMETLKMMVSIGLGWSVLPASMLSDDLTVMNIKSVKLERQLGLVQHQQRTLSNAAKMLVLELKKQKKLS